MTKLVSTTGVVKDIPDHLAGYYLSIGWKVVKATTKPPATKRTYAAED